MIMGITNEERIMGTLKDSFVAAITPEPTMDVPAFTEKALEISGLQKLG